MKKSLIKTNKSKLTGKARKGFKIYAMVILCIMLCLCTGLTAFAANDPVAVVNNLSTFIFGLIRAVGISLKSHDPSQRANGFLTVAGGIVITFAKEILDLIVA